jgi:hypothetical protein
MKPARNMFAWCSILMSSPVAAQAPAVTVQPAQPSMERSRCCILLSFDFELRAPGADTLTLESIQAVLLDSRGKQLAVQRADRNGAAVALAPATVVPGKVTTVANPFKSIDAKNPITSVHYTLEFRGPSGTVQTVATVSPVTYLTRTDLVIPVEGRILLGAGRDATAPKSRMDQAVASDLSGFRRQFNRYAYDLMVVDSAGALSRNGGATESDWYGFRAVVVSPAAGVVRVAENHMRDNTLASPPRGCCMMDPKWIAGNYIVIDHENGECSLLAHLRQGSQSVAPGDRVTRGQRIAEVGLSGDSFSVPHLHYQLMDSCDFGDAEGLPSRFSSFERLSGPNDGQEVKAHVGPGEVVLVRPYFKR